MADFEKRIELTIQLKCIDEEEKDVATNRVKEVFSKDFRIDSTVNKDVLTSRISAILLGLNAQLPDDFKQYMVLDASENDYWSKRKDNVIHDLKVKVKDLENRLHTMYTAFHGLEINCRRSKEIAKELFNGRL